MIWWRTGQCDILSIRSKSFLRLFHTSSSLQNYYTVLGIQKNATQREIKAAYYKLSKKFHPDVAGNNENATKKFHALNEAYECLKDPNRRRAYDNQATGAGGRYTGDYRHDPFANFNNRNDGRYQNPFHNQQFTQQEYERIWREFNRLKNEKMTYDQRMEFERQRMWMEFNKNRAERWKEFHRRYAEGPPGSVKWEFRSANGNQQRIYNGWELFRRIMLVYFVCFFIISFVKIVLQSIGDVRNTNNVAILSEKEQLEQLMGKVPGNDSSRITNFMNQVPITPPVKRENDADDEFELYQSTSSDSTNLGSAYSGAYEPDRRRQETRHGYF